MFGHAAFTPIYNFGENLWIAGGVDKPHGVISIIIDLLPLILIASIFTTLGSFMFAHRKARCISLCISVFILISAYIATLIFMAIELQNTPATTESLIHNPSLVADQEMSYTKELDSYAYNHIDDKLNSYVYSRINEARPAIQQYMNATFADPHSVCTSDNMKSVLCGGDQLTPIKYQYDAHAGNPGTLKPALTYSLFPHTQSRGEPTQLVVVKMPL